MVSGHRSRSARLVAAGLIAFLVVTSLLLLGGYLFDWRWTGSRTKKGPKELWDWLTLLLQPFALLLVPLWLRAGSRRTRDWLVLAHRRRRDVRRAGARRLPAALDVDRLRGQHPVELAGAVPGAVPAAAGPAVPAPRGATPGCDT